MIRFNLLLISSIINRKEREVFIGMDRHCQKGKINLRIVLIAVALLILLAGGYFLYQHFFDRPEESDRQKQDQDQALVLESKIANSHLSKVADTNGVYWLREADLVWNEIEPVPGRFNWQMMDEKVREIDKRDGYPLVIVKPFANWDQQSCHPDPFYDSDQPAEKGGRLKVGAPCDIEAYKSFLNQAVERYDGDGSSDMLGLKQPIRYWEIMNEPVMQGGSTGGMGEELKFFVGTSDEYLKILEASYQTIKQADRQAMVVQGGMAGMQKEVKDFWQPIMDQNGGKYFDIANIHTISTESDREDLYMVKFNNWLKSYNIENKPVWITEVQYGSLTEKPADLSEFEKLMVRSTVFSLALGADKLFYIDNWLRWDGGRDEPMGKGGQKETGSQALNSSTHKVYLNLVDKVNQFEEIKVIEQKYIDQDTDYSGAVSQIGQYKFIKDQNRVYALWGRARLPNEITGQVKLTDIYGQERIVDAAEIKLTDQPVFIEPLS